MPRIQEKEIYWSSVEGSDVVGYRVYTAESTIAFSYTLPYITTTSISVIAPTDFPSGTFDIETDYNIWITAIDDAGNESDPLALTSPFDFLPPNPPSDGGVRDY